MQADRYFAGTPSNPVSEHNAARHLTNLDKRGRCIDLEKSARTELVSRSGRRRIKSAVHAASQNSMPAQLALEIRYRRACRRTNDFLEGAKAFTEKRKPIFSAR